MEELYLIYVEPIGVNSNGENEYDFYFSETPEMAWAEDWAEQCPSACENLRPEGDFVTEIKRLKTTVPFFCAQQNSCFSMQDCMDGIIALAFENISDYEEYPEPFRIIFKYGEEYEHVKEKLSTREQDFEN